MSRCSLKSKDEKTVIVGIDHMGVNGGPTWFIQVYTQHPSPLEDEIHFMADCGRNQLLDYMEQYTVMKEDEYTAEVLHYVVLDFDPGLINPRTLEGPLRAKMDVTYYPPEDSEESNV